MNGSGKFLRSYRVDRTFQELIIPVENLQKDVYMYLLKSEGGIIGSGNLIHD